MSSTRNVGVTCNNAIYIKYITDLTDLGNSTTISQTIHLNTCYIKYI
jgi:hypothetical protein